MEKLQAQYFDHPEETFAKSGVLQKPVAYTKPKPVLFYSSSSSIRTSLSSSLFHGTVPRDDGECGFFSSHSDS